MDSGGWGRFAGLMEYGLGLAVIAAGAVSALLIVGGVIGLVAFVLLTGA